VLGSQLPMGEQEAHQRFGARHLDGTPSPSLEFPLQRSLLNGEVITGYRDLLRHAGSGRDVQILANSAPLLDDTGAVTGAVSVFQDITPLNEQEHAREDFLGAVAHDLKNPLTAIRGHAQLGRRRLTKMVLPGADRVVEQFTQIETSTAGMLAMINELLDVARLHAGADLELQREPIDFVALLGEAVARQQEMSSQHIHYESEAPTVMVHLDHSRMDRVLANVLSNAASYSQESTAITVRLAHVSDASGDWAEVTVQDQGIGIPAADLPHVFDRFHRGANAIGRIRGTGIGLATAQKIIEQHGGTILLSSQEGIGTTVRMRLPLEPATSRVDESPAST
jgi:signal transduction histidine kinase